MSDMKPQCAPIIIPTLCRYEHLKKCVESLKQSSLAKYTKLYISIDFPTKKEHEEGYKKVKQYVMHEINGFEEVIYYLQQSNLGPLENIRFLVQEVYKSYDRYIFTEDDNLFAPAAIDYWNKGLTIFEKNKNIIGICAKAWSEYNNDDKENVFLSKSFSAYGYATWKDREQEWRSKITKELPVNIIKNKKVFREICHSNIIYMQALLNIALEKEAIHYNADGKLSCTDFEITLYMMYYNKYAVYPRRFLTKNMGFDGSGVNCKEMALEDKNLDERESFDIYFSGDLPVIEENLKRYKWYHCFERVFLKLEAFLFIHLGSGWYAPVQKILCGRNKA